MNEKTEQTITYDGLVVDLVKAYITAGSTGMPTPEQLVKYAIDTADEIYKQLEIE